MALHSSQYTPRIGSLSNLPSSCSRVSDQDFGGPSSLNTSPPQTGHLRTALSGTSRLPSSQQSFGVRRTVSRVRPAASDARFSDSDETNRNLLTVPANGDITSLSSASSQATEHLNTQTSFFDLPYGGHVKVRQTVAARFWAKVDVSAGPTGCWLWLASKGKGYGKFSMPRQSPVEAHRMAYILVHGAVPDGLELDHLCRNTLCVNPAHLEAVTHTENVRRGARGNLITHCPQGHPYTEDNTYTKPNRNSRQCRECSRIRKRKTPYTATPYAARDTSVEAAVALTPRVGKWQARVLEALACRPMSDEQLELYLGCERTRTSRPRRRELELLGLVEDSGERITGIGGTHVCVWRLTAAGIEKAKELSA